MTDSARPRSPLRADQRRCNRALHTSSTSLPALPPSPSLPPPSSSSSSPPMPPSQPSRLSSSPPPPPSSSSSSSYRRAKSLAVFTTLLAIATALLAFSPSPARATPPLPPPPPPAPPASTQASDPSLLHLSAVNWTANIKQGSWLIDFYSPYCNHCKAFLPIWQRLTQSLNHLSTEYPDTPFRLAQVDCFTNRDLCVEEGVPYFPRLSVYRDGILVPGEYAGERDYSEIAKWTTEQAEFYREAKKASGQAPLPLSIAPGQPQQAPAKAPADANADSPAAGAVPGSGPGAGVGAGAPPPQQPPPPVPPKAQNLPDAAAAPKQPGIVPGPQDADFVPANDLVAPPVPPVAQAAQDDGHADVSPPLPPTSPPPPPPPPEEVIDESLPNPRGEMMRYGISPQLKTPADLQAWLGLPSRNASQPQDYRLPKEDSAANTNEGNEGTGSAQKSPGYGGAYLSGHQSDGDEEHIFKDPLLSLPDRAASIAKGGTFVKFFAPWCPHCKAMAQSFEKLAPALKNKLNVMEIDCEANKALCRSYQIRSFPTIRLYSPVHQLVSEYRGGRNFDAMLKWCEKAAEEEIVDLVEARDEGHWRWEISGREEVRFLWLSDGGETSEEWKAEKTLITIASRALFTSPFRVYRSSHPSLVEKFRSRMSQTKKGGFRSVLLAFKDFDSDQSIASYSVPPPPDAHSRLERSQWAAEQRSRMSQWLDWNRYPTVNAVGGESYIDVVNNAHSAPVVLALLSDEHHDGKTYAVGSGSARKDAEIAALKRMAIGWRESGQVFKWASKKETYSKDIKFESNGGLLWGWMDGDRWRKAVQKYYSTKPTQFPALVLIDSSTFTYYPLPTLKPSKLVASTSLDVPQEVIQQAHSGDGAADAAVKAAHMHSAYGGQSQEVSDWLGRGAGADTGAGSSPAVVDAASHPFYDDLQILPFLLDIGAGKKSSLARSSRSYIDESLRHIEGLAGLAAKHWFLSGLLITVALWSLIKYVRFTKSKGSSDGHGGPGLLRYHNGHGRHQSAHHARAKSMSMKAD